MDENVIVTTFSKDSRAYEALARLKQLAAEGQIDLRDGEVVERAPRTAHCTGAMRRATRATASRR